MLALIATAALAGTWSLTDPHAFDIKNTLGPASPMPELREKLVASCIVGTSTPDAHGQATDGPDHCRASDAGLSFSTSHPDFTFKTRLATISGVNYVQTYLEFTPGADASGWSDWPSSWPTSVSASRTFGPYTHAYVVPIGSDPNKARYKAPVIETVASWGTQINLLMDSSWDKHAMMRMARIPDGSYSGASASGIVQMTSDTANTNPIAGTACRVLDQDNTSGLHDYVVVVAKHSLSTQSVYCPVTYNGTAYDKHVKITH